MEDDLSEELQFHLQNEIKKDIVSGMTLKLHAMRRCAGSAEWTK